MDTLITHIALTHDQLRKLAQTPEQKEIVRGIIVNAMHGFERSIWADTFIKEIGELAKLRDEVCKPTPFLPPAAEQYAEAMLRERGVTVEKPAPESPFKLYWVTTVSVDHLPRNDAKLLTEDTDRERCSLRVHDLSCHGWLVYAQNLPDQGRLKARGYSDALIRLLTDVGKVAAYLKLDKDGPIIPGYATFKW